MARRKTRGEVAISSQLQTLEPSSERYKVLVAARDFKAAWVELGERLTVVRESEKFLAWGYTSFEGYCRRELHIKADTAAKLTRSYSFLRDHEPGVLKGREQREMPPLDVVDMLSMARERSKVSEGELRTIREEVLAPDNNPTKSQVVRRLREIDPNAFKPTPKAATKGDSDAELRKALLLAERLHVVLEGVSGISRETTSAVKRIVTDLKERFEASQQKQSA
jgi:hypothetical protein